MPTSNFGLRFPSGPSAVDVVTDITNLANDTDAALASLIQSYETMMTGGILTLTTSFQDVAGTSQAFTTVRAHAVALVTAVFDINPTVTASNNVFVGILNVDGVGLTTEAHGDDRVSRAGPTQTYRVALTPGSHTFKLQAKITGGTILLNPTHTTMQVLVLDLP